MANLSIRKLDEDVLKRLRIRAAKNGVSMEEEVRRILKQAVTVPERLGDFALDTFGQEGGVGLELPKHEPHEPMDFSK